MPESIPVTHQHAMHLLRTATEDVSAAVRLTQRDAEIRETLGLLEPLAARRPDRAMDGAARAQLLIDVADVKSRIRILQRELATNSDHLRLLSHQAIGHSTPGARSPGVLR